jgi:hypothetical protein
MKLTSPSSKAIFVVAALLLFDDSNGHPVGQTRNFLDGFKSDGFRIQFSFRYNFSKTFTY